MHLVEILLPVADNEGQPFEVHKYAVVREELSRRFGGITCPYHKSNPDILMMQSTKDGQWLDASDCVHRTSSWRVFRQR